MKLSELFPMIRAIAAEFGLNSNTVSADYAINERKGRGKPYTWHNYNVFVQPGDGTCYIGRGTTPQLALEDLRKTLAAKFGQPEFLTQTEEPELA